ncbi:sulfurtransferase [Pseudoalteromonas sp. T1lg65]|uniref:sulfurtransferase n=1 Tax=Pseudoalteromonas sp. T1lg65 TaxID=2077101 RepID=UPI003F7A734A
MKNVVSVAWLKANIDKVKVLDAGILKPSEQGEYKAEAIIKNALRFDINHALADPHSGLPNTMCSAMQFQAEMRQLGINNTDTLVVYDDKGMFSAARAWWMLKSMGHQQVFVLDGGLPAWQASQGEVVQQYQTAHGVGDFDAEYDERYFIGKEQVLSSIDDLQTLLLDARGAKRFSGVEKEPRADMRSGHVPKAKSLPYTTLLEVTGCFKPLHELAVLFEQVGANQKMQLQFSCGSGVTACILALVADELGYKNLTVYDGSWSEWGADSSLPIEQ